MKTKYFFLFFALAFFVLFLRRPDAILNAQFWAEDGKIFFSQAYNFGGIQSLFAIQDGYFHTFARVVALISLMFPIQKAPLIFNISALLVQILPALLILSSRFQRIIPPLFLRVLLALLFLFLPNTAEIHGNISNAQWFLAVSSFLVLIFSESNKKFWKISDYVILFFGGLSGPFSIFLFPIAFLLYSFRKNSQTMRNVIFIGIMAGVQIIGILFLGEGNRLHMFPEFSWKLAFVILGRQIIWGSLIGANGSLWVLDHFPWYEIAFIITVCVALLFLMYTAFEAPLELKFFLLLSSFVFIGGLLSPTGNFENYDSLEILSQSTDGIRYWFIGSYAIHGSMNRVWPLEINGIFCLAHLAPQF